MSVVAVPLTSPEPLTGPRRRPAGWYVSVPPTPLFSAAGVAAWLRIDSPDAAALAQLAECVAAATDYAEDRMAMALMRQTVTATFYAGDTLRLPRTPVLAVVSVTGDPAVAVTDYDLYHAGTAAFIQPNVGFVSPLTVVYEAGYESADAVPAGIRQAVRAHVGTLWENRESVSRDDLHVVPHSLDAFYRLKSRNPGVG